VRKRSLTIAGHRTSVALEPEFWVKLDDMAAERGVTTAALIAEIDEGREGPNLSSALRVAVLQWLEARTASRARPG
jgi:predicted DNA-binding ribbon-helix-helix protein